MQVPALDAASLLTGQTGAGVTARVVSGNLATLPIGSLLEATVTSVTPREVALTVNGLPLTVRTPVGAQLQPGTALLVRVPPTAANAANPTVELSVPPNPAPGQKPTSTSPALPQLAGTASAQTAAVATRVTPASSAVPTGGTQLPSAPPRLAVVDVLNPLPDGRVRVKIDGEEQIATSPGPLTSGGRYVLQVERTPTGLRLNPPPDGPKLPTEIATAVLRAPAPTLPESLKPLQAELATLTNPSAPNGKALPVPGAVRDAAVAVQNTLRAFVPSDPRPPAAGELQQLVENGGLHFEAKLARLLPDPEAPVAKPANAATTAGTETSARETGRTTDAPRAANAEHTQAPAERATRAAAAAPRDANSAGAATSDRAAAPTARDPGPDLKGDLLRLLQAVNDLGGTARAPAAEAAVRGIEAQQAANTLAQANGTPYFIQVPFPDGGVWRTLNLSLEPQNQPDQPDAERAGRFRVFMHVPLTDLGETWIDAGLAGDRFRATIYLDRSAVRDRVRAALPDLRTELQSGGFSEVLLDVRSSSDLPERHRREAGAMQAGRPSAVSVLDVRA